MRADVLQLTSTVVINSVSVRDLGYSVEHSPAAEVSISQQIADDVFLLAVTDVNFLRQLIDSSESVVNLGTFLRSPECVAHLSDVLWVSQG